jgi:hypothetical protein
VKKFALSSLIFVLAGMASTAQAAVTLTLTPSASSVALGGSLTLTATVTGTTNLGLTWSVNGVTNGSSTEGTLTSCTKVAPLTCKYTAPSVDVPNPNPVTFKIVSKANPSVSKTATATVTDSIAVTLTPASASVALGGTQVFTATLSGSTNTGLDWYVNGVQNGNSSEGTLTACTATGTRTCTYTAPSSKAPSPNPAVIKVASAADTSKFATANVTVTIPPPTITSFVASPATISAGQSSTLTAVFAYGTGEITPGNLAVSSGAGAKVSPTTTTVYTLTVTPSTGSAITQAVTVYLQSSVTVEQSSSGVAVTDQLMGMNMAAWYDLVTNQTAIVDAFQTAGIKAVRWPGGSWSDLYHWETNSNCEVAPYGLDAGQPDANDDFGNFVTDLAIPAGLDVALTADYGTNPTCNGGGEPSEAANWVANALDYGITVSHMTVGNEVYGSTWEEDLHSPPNNPATYAAAVVGASGYYQSVKAASPDTLVGVVVDADDSTGGWDNVVLSKAKGFYDFVEYHYYPEAPGEENDTTLVHEDAQGLTTDINTIKSELAKWGTPNTPIYVGEIGSVYSDPGKQSVSITQALYAGQILGEMMNDGVSRATWWLGFGGCEDSASGTGANFSSSLYGWQDFGGYMVFSDGLPEYDCEDETLAAGILLPTARVYQLFSSVAVSGEHVLSATAAGDTASVRAYAATHSGGTALVLFNLDENSSAPVTITLSAESSSPGVTVATYSKAIYDQSQNNVWAAPATVSLGAQTFPLSLTLPAWSMNVVIIQ